MKIRKTPEGYEAIGDVDAHTVDGLHASEITPRGLIVMWNGLIANIPAGWVICDGFNGTPNLKAKFVRGAPAGQEAGGTGGEDTHTLTVAEMPSHNHSMSAHWEGAVDVKYLLLGKVIADSNYGWATNYTGGGQAHENRPAYYQLIFIMKT